MSDLLTADDIRAMAEEDEILVAALERWIERNGHEWSTRSARQLADRVRARALHHRALLGDRPNLRLVQG